MSKQNNLNNHANLLNSNKRTLGFYKAYTATMKNHGEQLKSNKSSLTSRQQFVQFYESPRILATESTALQELLLLTRIQENFPTTDPYILGFYVTRVLLIRELFPSLYIESKNFFKAIVQNKNSTSKWQEIKFKRQLDVLNPIPMKPDFYFQRKNNGKKKEQVKRPELKNDIPIILVSGSNCIKEPLEDACGYKITRHITVERNSQAIKKLQALWNTTHMQPFGIIVCTCKHISHTVTRTMEKNINGSSDWVMINSFNDNVQMIAQQIKDAIDKHWKEN